MSESLNQKIAKLLRLAERAGTPEEAESASRMAEKLMLKWGIEEATIRANMGDAKPEEIVIKRIPFPHLFVKARTGVAHSIVRGMGNLKSWNYIGAVIDGKADAKGYTIAIMGFESDVDRAITLINSLVLQADHSLAQWWKEYRRGPGKGMKASEQFRAKRQFLMSFGHAVQMRLSEMRAEVVQEEMAKAQGSTSTEVALLDRGAAVEKEYQDKYASGMKAGRGVKGSWAGSAEGRAAGQRANLGQRGLGGPRGAIGS